MAKFTAEEQDQITAMASHPIDYEGRPGKSVSKPSRVEVVKINWDAPEEFRFWNNDNILLRAARLGDYAVTLLLLQKGFDMNFVERVNNGLTPLMAAAYNGHVKVVELLISKNATMHDKVRNALYTAAGSGHEDVVELLLANKAPVDQVNRLGNTPLFAAVMNGHVNITRLLLAKGADVNQKINVDFFWDPGQCTTLWDAAMNACDYPRNSREIAKALLTSPEPMVDMNHEYVDVILKLLGEAFTLVPKIVIVGGDGQKEIDAAVSKNESNVKACVQAFCSPLSLLFDEENLIPLLLKFFGDSWSDLSFRNQDAEYVQAFCSPLSLLFNKESIILSLLEFFGDYGYYIASEDAFLEEDVTVDASGTHIEVVE